MNNLFVVSNPSLLRHLCFNQLNPIFLVISISFIISIALITTLLCFNLLD